MVGLAYGQIFTGEYTPVMFASIYGGQEKPYAEGVPWLGDTFVGLRAGGQLRLSLGFTAFGTVAYERREYGGEDPTFLVVRKDNQTDAIVGLSYLLRANTTLVAQYAYTNNESNIPIDVFNRNLASISLRFNF